MTTPADSLFETPAPVLFNVYKHHAGALRQRIAQAAREGDASLPKLAEEIVVMGTELMDLYIGALTPADIARHVLEILSAEGRLEVAAYGPWIDGNGGYQSITFQDATVWVLRHGTDADRYVHVHPGRWTPETKRVRANVLKTAVMVLAHCAIHGGDPLAVDVVNDVRTRLLGLSPVKTIAPDEGLGIVVNVLRESAAS